MPETSAATAPPVGRLNGYLGRWQVRVGLYLLVVLGLVCAYRFDFLPGMADALVECFAYTACATTLTPLPTIPAILYAATKAPPLAVAVVGALGTVVAYLIEYALFRQLLRLSAVNRVRDSGLYRWLAGVFRSVPFVALTIAAFLPLPVDGIRIMAIAEHYSRVKYAVAAFLGRVPRYWLLAAWGKSMTWSWELIAALGGGAAALALVQWWLSRRRRQNRAALLIAGSLLLPVVADAQPAPPSVEAAQRLDGILERLDRAVGKLTDAHASFVQQRYSPVFDDTEETHGELWYRAPGDVALHYRDPEQHVYIDTAGVWLYLVDHAQAQRYPFQTPAERDASLAMLWRPAEELGTRYTVAVAETPPTGEEPGDWLALTPHDPDLAEVVTALYLRIGAKGLSDCIVVERTDGDRVRLEVVAFDWNPGIDDTVFLFDPPPDVDIQRFGE